MTQEGCSGCHGLSHDGEPDYRFCPVCGHHLHTELIKPSEPERLVCGRCGFIFYLDPKVAVGTLGTLEGRVILLKRGIEPAYGRWVFPGGYVNRGETAPEAGIRETKEEVNLDVRIETLLNVYSYPGRPVILIVYTVSIVGGEFTVGDEALEVKTFAPEDIPWRDLAFPSTRDALQDYVKKHLNSKGIRPPSSSVPW
jgi:ADP-ribose pyrophosphatase YjhB (NUDIX family)